MSLNLPGFVRNISVCLCARHPLIFTQPVLLVGDMKTAKDILEKHAARFSSRPAVPYFVCHGLHRHLHSTHIRNDLSAVTPTPPSLIGERMVKQKLIISDED